MKNKGIFIGTLLLIMSFNLNAQLGINYKALIKDGGGNVVVNQNVTVQFQILKGGAMTNVYQETHTSNTDANGIVLVNIGEGSVDSGSYSGIDWGSDDHYLNVQINTGGGLTDMGTTQFMAVPYALHARSSTSDDQIQDVDNDTKIQVEESADEDIIRFDIEGNEIAYMDDKTFHLGASNQNMFIGVNAGVNYVSGLSNTLLGFSAGGSLSSGGDNTILGRNAGITLQTGSKNTLLGRSAGASVIGSDNTMIGHFSGVSATGSGHVFVGHNAGANEAGNNKLYIDNSNADADNALIYGEFDGEILRTNGQFQIGNPSGTGFRFPLTDGSANQVMQTNGSGTLTWINSSSFGAQKINDLLDGKSDNDGTNDGSSLFLGLGAGTNDDATNNHNVGIGFESMVANTSGRNNTVIVSETLWTNTTVNFNTSTGYQSMYFNTTGSNNSAYGHKALEDNTTGTENTALGLLALASNTTGSQNTAVGNLALNITSGLRNTALGMEAGYNTTGSNNVFLGYRAGYNETGSNKLYISNSNADADNALIYGDFNGKIFRVNGDLQIADPNGTGYVFPITDGSANQLLQTSGSGGLSWVDGFSLGPQQINDLSDGRSDNDGSSNGSSVFIGLNAGANDDMSDNGNVGLGFESMNGNSSGARNSGLGYQSLKSNTTGNANSGLGYQALFTNTTGINNTAVGQKALANNTSGSSNTAVGSEALFTNSTGIDNTASGYLTMQKNTIGNDNSAYGANALNNNTIGSENVGVGKNALLSNTQGDRNTAIGFDALYSNTTGIRNSANGVFALYGNTTGNENTAIGYDTLSFNTTGSNNTAIGNNAQVPDGTADNQVRIGDTNVTLIEGQVAWSFTSDRRWKENIRKLPYGLDFIRQLKPVDYIRQNNEHQTREIGFIAQDVEALLNKVGYKEQGFLTKDSKGRMSLRYNDIIPLLTKAIQEQQQIIETEKAKNKALEVRLEKVEQIISKMSQ